MTPNLLSLFCLVDGDATPFSVEVDRTKTVDHLKDLITAKKAPEFDDIAADKLNLWRVSIPIVPPNKRKPIVLTEVKSAAELDPTDDLSDVFEEKQPKKTIHVMVQRPPLDSTFSRTPTEIIEWTHFPTEAAELNHSTNRRLRPADYHFNTRLFASNKESVGIALTENVYNFLNRLQTTARIGMYSDIDKVTGKPDRICYIRTSQELRMLIEIKTTQALSCNNLVTKYMQDMDLIANDRAPTNPIWRQVHQIFGYLCHNSLRYGILTTYNDTWFMKRDVGTLWISPSIRHDNTGPTLLQCYKYLMELTDQDYISPPPPPSPPQSPPPESPPGDDNSDGSNGGSYHERKKRTRKRDQRHPGIVTRSRNKMQQIFRQLPSGFTVSVGKLGLQEFEIQELLGEGRTGRVFRAMWQGEPVALKICDLYKNPEYEDEILTEVAAYKALEALQGVCIPRFKTAGYDGGIFAIAMEVAGSPMEVDKLSYRERLKIVDSLSLIHQHGILHNDIRLYNVLVCRCDNGFHVHFIDFAQSRRNCNELELKNEMIKLKSTSTCHSRPFSALVQAPSSAAQQKLKYIYFQQSGRQ
ncbi:MAG: kinase-like domain-containing protein [Podila humilis]|nr:MAG: kinase-like domain-containing protein [Podila humilis]